MITNFGPAPSGAHRPDNRSRHGYNRCQRRVAVHVGLLPRDDIEAIMNAIISMALVLGVGGLAGAADDKAVDPVGTWKCEYEIGGSSGHPL